MPVFKYKAKKGVNEIVEGALVAETQVEAINKLAKQDLSPIEVELQSPPVSAERTSPARGGLTKPITFKTIFQRIPKRRISSKELLIFTQKLATLTRAKMELLPSLKILYDQMDHPAFKEIILKVYNWIKEGRPLSEALQGFPAVFPSLFISIVRAGEVSGNLEAALTQITDFMQRQEGLKNKVWGALIYPIILLCVGFLSIFVILNFVIPRLEGIFVGLGGSLPVITKVILSLSRVTAKNWVWVFSFLIIILLVLFHRDRRGRTFARIFKILLMKLPIIRRLLKNQELANFSRSLNLLIRSGVTPLQSLEIAKLSVEDLRMRKELEEVTKKIEGGQTIFESMSGFKSLPDFFIKMIAVGEESGRLEEVLDEVANSYVQQIESDISVVTSMLEPILILILGIILGGIVLSILLPIFQVTQMIH